MSTPIAVDAPAKLNLYLHIVGRNSEGYHLLESLVAFTRSGDRLSAAPAETLGLETDGPFAAPLRETADEDNLVLKAARRLEAWASAEGHRVPGARLHLDKILPVASGIGGGSADAAAALLALKQLWHLPIAMDALLALAQSLGSDVPACVAGEAALMEGVGERLSPVPALPSVPVLLVNPGVALPVYRAFRETCAIEPGTRLKPIGPFADAAQLSAALGETRNDLEVPAIALCPPIAAVLRALEASSALFWRMSGSGATCFGLFADPVAATIAAAQLKQDQPGWWVLPTALRGAV